MSKQSKQLQTSKAYGTEITIWSWAMVMVMGIVMVRARITIVLVASVIALGWALGQATWMQKANYKHSLQKQRNYLSIHFIRLSVGSAGALGRATYLQWVSREQTRNNRWNTAMLCTAMHCYALICIAMHCYILLCTAMLCYALLCFGGCVEECGCTEHFWRRANTAASTLETATQSQSY